MGTKSSKGIRSTAGATNSQLTQWPFNFSTKRVGSRALLLDSSMEFLARTAFMLDFVVHPRQSLLPSFRAEWREHSRRIVFRSPRVGSFSGASP